MFSWAALFKLDLRLNACLTERLLMGRKESNQTNIQNIGHIV